MEYPKGRAHRFDDWPSRSAGQRRAPGGAIRWRAGRADRRARRGALGCARRLDRTGRRRIGRWPQWMPSNSRARVRTSATDRSGHPPAATAAARCGHRATCAHTGFRCAGTTADASRRSLAVPGTDIWCR
eukprot:ctg_63.g12